MTFLLDAIVDVKSFAKQTLEVEECRPERCSGCGIGAGNPGCLKIHGHGTRARETWTPPTGEGPPEVLGLLVRRYRCLNCKHVMTVRPRFLARYFRYATAAIALAFWLWAALGLKPATVREQVSPWPVRGFSEPHRWRSLARWLGRLGDLFGLEEGLVGEGRELAGRVAGLLEGRGPPGVGPRVRVFVGAQLR